MPRRANSTPPTRAGMVAASPSPPATVPISSGRKSLSLDQERHPPSAPSSHQASRRSSTSKRITAPGCRLCGAEKFFAGPNHRLAQARHPDGRIGASRGAARVTGTTASIQGGAGRKATASRSVVPGSTKNAGADSPNIALRYPSERPPQPTAEFSLAGSRSGAVGVTGMSWLALTTASSTPSSPISGQAWRIGAGRSRAMAPSPSRRVSCSTSYTPTPVWPLQSQPIQQRRPEHFERVGQLARPSRPIRLRGHVCCSQPTPAAACWPTMWGLAAGQSLGGHGHQPRAGVAS